MFRHPYVIATFATALPHKLFLIASGGENQAELIRFVGALVLLVFGWALNRKKGK